MAIEFDPPLIRDLGANPGKVEFNNLETLLSWAVTEQQRWAAVTSSAEHSHMHENARNKQSSGINQIINNAREFQNQFGMREIPKGNLDQFRGNIEQLLDAYKHGSVIHSDSAIGKFILNAAQSEPREAFSMLGLLTGGPTFPRAQENFDVVSLIRADQKVRAFRAGTEPEAASTTAAYETLIAKVSADLAEKSQQHADLVRKGQELKNQLATEVANATERVTAAEKKQIEDIGQTKTELTNEYARLKKWFENELATQEPVTYWRQKADSHRLGAILWAFGFVALLLLVLSGLYEYGAPVIDKVMQNGTFSLTPVVLVTIPTFLALWLLRVCSRMFTVNIGLLWDARERVSMAMTFLALLKQSDALKDQERSEIIKSLFRPAVVTGGDESPSALLDGLVSKIAGKS